MAVKSIRVDRNVPMKMRDGVILRADIFRPDDDEKHPAILIRTPYNKLLSASSDFLSPVDSAFADYAVVIQDVRGRFASEGKYMRGDLATVEGPDGYDSVEWVADERWCDGNVGMAGGSYLAHLQWVAAMQNPPHLKAIAPSIGSMGPALEENLVSGVSSLHIASYFVPVMGIDIADRLEQQGKDVSEMRRIIQRALFHQEEVYNFLPLKDVPFAQFEGLREIWNGWVLNSVPRAELLNTILKRFVTNDEPPNIRWAYHQVTIPCFQVSGWYDVYTHSVFQNFLNMRKNAGSQLARESQHVLMGPWAHETHLPNFLGELHFGPQGSGRGAMVGERHLAFFDKYLRGRDVNVPAVRYFVMTRNIWENADTWPLPQTQWQRFFLHSRGNAQTAHGDGLLSRDEPTSEPTDTFFYNPHTPVPTLGGRNEPLMGLLAGPMNQSSIESRDDVLCYTTHELEQDVEITGPLTLHLFASTSAVDTDFTARLSDVYPDGRSLPMAEGILRARYRKSVFQPQLVNPGEVYEFCIVMAATSNLFRKNHRIRIHISSSNFPRYDRNMNTGHAVGEDAQGIIAKQTVYHQPEYASYIDLPVIPVSKTRK